MPSIPDFENTENTLFWQSNLKDNMVWWYLEDSSIAKAFLYAQISFATYKDHIEYAAYFLSSPRH